MFAFGGQQQFAPMQFGAPAACQPAQFGQMPAFQHNAQLRQRCHEAPALDMDMDMDGDADAGLKGCSDLKRGRQAGWAQHNYAEDMVAPCGPVTWAFPGQRVQRNPSFWAFGDQDGGKGAMGTVMNKTKSQGWVWVRWDNGLENNYRAGAEQKWDLLFA